MRATTERHPHSANSFTAYSTLSVMYFVRPCEQLYFLLEESGESKGQPGEF